LVKGIRLTLMIGPAVPVPVSKDVLDALTEITVTTTSGKTSGFQLTFNLSTRSPLHTIFLLTGGSMIPMIRVIIIITLNGISQVIMDGVMTNHEVTPGKDASQATLTVTGEDLSRVMSYIDFSGIPYPAMPAEARVLLILAKYAVLGIVPMVIPSVMVDVPLPTERIPMHKGKDLGYIKCLADKVGYVFYVEPGPTPGMNIAYWGPEIKVGVPQPALNINMDAHTNVESLNCSFNADNNKIPVVFIQEKHSKAPIPIPIPKISPINPPLGWIPPIPKGYEPIEKTAKYSPLKAVLVGMAEASKMADAVSASGSLNVVRYGRLLKARRLVGVRGVGTAFDGLYYVSSVTHKIKRGEYKQDFKLIRNGLISTLPKVPA